MNTSSGVAAVSSYKGHRFLAEIISLCVWLHFRFSLSFRDVEERMAERGVVVSYEAIREWCMNFGAAYAKRIRVQRARLGDRWHLDEVFLKIQGKLQYLWRAVDQDGEVLDILVQPRRNRQAAKKFFRKLLKELQYVPRAIITDKLRSYSADKAKMMPSVEHQQERGLNNRAENCHQPTRQPKRQMRGFKSSRHAQRFLSAFGVIASFLRPGRHIRAARNYREIMRRRFAQWRELVGVQATV